MRTRAALLALLATFFLSTSCAIPPARGSEPEVPHSDPEPAPNGGGGRNGGPNDPPGAGRPNSGGNGEDGRPESEDHEFAEHLLDAASEIVKELVDNLAIDGSTSTTPTRPAISAPQPTAPRHPSSSFPHISGPGGDCLSVASLYSACSVSSNAAISHTGDIIDQINNPQTSTSTLLPACMCYTTATLAQPTQQTNPTVTGSFSSSLVWAPQRFDGWVSACEDWVQSSYTPAPRPSVTGTAAKESLASEINAGLGWCKNKGDIVASASKAAAAAAAATKTAAAQQAPSIGGGSGSAVGMGFWRVFVGAWGAWTLVFSVGRW